MPNGDVEFRGITPYIFCRDAAAMLRWYSETFGFEEKSRWLDERGRVHNAEMCVGHTELWLDGTGAERSRTDGSQPAQYIGVWVDDVDAMHERVRASGVDAEPPEDKPYGVRTFGVTDPEGHRWFFMHPIPVAVAPGASVDA